MVPEDITPVCHKMKVVVEKFKPKGAEKGTMNCYLNGAKQKLSKEDYFRRNCGFLTESEEDRYRNIPSFQGSVKRLKPIEELWAGGEEDRPGGADRLDLEEFHLWQTDEQPRRCVGPGSLATSYTRLLSLAANPTALQQRVEAAAAAQENSRNQHGREKKPSGGILDYFQKKQKLTPEDTELTLEGITEELEIAKENEDNFGNDISMVDNAEVGISPEEEENTPSKVNAIDDEEEQLVQDLLPESYFDSGVYSPPSPPSLYSLRNIKASAELICKFDVSEAIANVVKRMGIKSPKKRYPTNEVDVEIIQAMPLVIVKQNSVEDMFADDSFLEEFIEENKEDTKNIDQTTIEDSSNTLKTRTEDAGATFDLESPVMSQASGGQPGEERETDSRVSTPLPGSSTALDTAPLPDLTPVAPHHNPRPALHTDIQQDKMKDVSSDLFDDSDDELLVNLALAPPCRAESIYTTSQLLNMMNDTEESVTPTRIKPRINNSKRKLSKVFDEVFDLESSILETTEDRELKKQNKLALEASVTESHHSLSFNEGNHIKEDEEFENQIKIALAASLQECRSKPNDESTERNEMSDDDDSPIIGSRSKRLNVIASQTAHNDDLHNCSEDSAKSSTEVAVRGESEAKAARVSDEGEKGCRCPVCDKLVTGDINSHIDICLNMNYISQEAGVGAGDLSDPGDQAAAAAAGADRPDDSPVLGHRKRKLNVLASQSVSQAGNSLNISDNLAKENLSHDKISTTRQKEPKKYKKRFNQFLDDEAELSGGSDSLDEEVEQSQVGYDKSFVDDQTQATDDRALYLRLGRGSPVARRERPLPPITDSIFSQAVDDFEEDYAKDSFCVGDSFVEYNSDQDTLDLAAVRRPGRAKPSRAKRRRILVAPEPDDTVLQPSQARPSSPEQEEESQSLLAAYSTTLQDSFSLREEKIKVRIYCETTLHKISRCHLVVHPTPPNYSIKPYFCKKTQTRYY